MKAKKYWILAGLLPMCLVVVCIANALTDKQLSTQGIVGLRVYVWLSDYVIKAGLLESQVRTDVELKLRRYGLKVLSESEYAPTLSVLITSVPVRREHSNNTIGYASLVSVQLDQYVQLLRNQRIIYATTWDTRHVGFWPQEKFVEDTRDVVSDKVDEFLNDYLAANPKETKTQKQKQ